MKRTPWILLIFVLFGISAFSGYDLVASFFSTTQLQKLTGHKYHDTYKEENRSALIKFSHAYHKTEVGAECANCHTGIEKSTSSSDNNLGKMDACYVCHDKKATDCQYCHAEAAEPYSAFENPKRELIFSHKQHVGDQQMKCETCHAGAETAAANHARLLPSMENCMTCHNGVKAGNDCRTCHTDLRFIRPADHKTDFLRVHKQTIAVKGDANCKMCHSEESCQDCHSGARLEKFSKKDISTPNSGALGGTSGTILNRVHTADFLFVHRFDAKSKTSDCKTCHETESFCARCHNESAKVKRPAWHDVGGFQTPKGTGGGMHAQLAKKDMENCISCHDVSDKDPTCLRCHNANGKAK